jgi:hypothetical protein
MGDVAYLILGIGSACALPRKFPLKSEGRVAAALEPPPMEGSIAAA